MFNNMKMTLKGEKETNIDNENDKENKCSLMNDTIEAVRKCSRDDLLNVSWEPNLDVHKDSESDIALPFVSIVMTDSRVDISTQTDPLVSRINCSVVDVNLSLGKEFDFEDSICTEQTDSNLVSRRYRKKSFEDNGDIRPSKKIKCSKHNSSYVTDYLTENKSFKSSDSSRLSSDSEVSFKSVNSNSSYKIRKRKLKSETNLLKDVLHRARKNISNCK